MSSMSTGVYDLQNHLDITARLIWNSAIGNRQLKGVDFHNENSVQRRRIQERTIVTFFHVYATYDTPRYDRKRMRKE